MVESLTPTPEQVAQAKEDYARAREVLMAAQEAEDATVKVALVGRCFKHTVKRSEEEWWLVYIAVTGLADGKLEGFHFQTLPTGQIEIAPERDLFPGFLLDECHEIDRDVLIVAFNDLLTTITRMAVTIPPKSPVR